MLEQTLYISVSETKITKAYISEDLITVTEKDSFKFHDLFTFTFVVSSRIKSDSIIFFKSYSQNLLSLRMLCRSLHGHGM